jgi:hypothetical protein
VPDLTTYSGSVLKSDLTFPHNALHVCRFSKTDAQAVPNLGVVTPITWQSVSTAFSGDASLCVVNNALSTFKAPYTGWYHVSARIFFNGGAGQSQLMAIATVNASNVVTNAEELAALLSDVQVLGGSETMFLTAGQRICITLASDGGCTVRGADVWNVNRNRLTVSWWA